MVLADSLSQVTARPWTELLLYEGVKNKANIFAFQVEVMSSVN